MYEYTIPISAYVYVGLTAMMLSYVTMMDKGESDSKDEDTIQILPTENEPVIAPITTSEIEKEEEPNGFMPEIFQESTEPETVEQEDDEIPVAEPIEEPSPEKGKFGGKKKHRKTKNKKPLKKNSKTKTKSRKTHRKK